MEIRPFKGVRFNPEVVGDPASCVAPPYDVIDPDAQQQLYDKSPHNIVRVIKGFIEDSDDPQNNQYTRAAEFLTQELQSGALKADSTDSIYAYVQDFDIAGQKFRRSGFVALGKLRQFGEGVQPHEKTLDGPKADRLNLMRATAAQFGQIFMLYDDPGKIADSIIEKASGQTPLVNLIDDDNVTHKLFAINDPNDIKAIEKMMADKTAVIADGHHRYETSLNYYAETQNPDALYRMMTFVNMRNEGLIILPTHRLIANVNGFNITDLVDKLKDCFEVTCYPFKNDTEKNNARKKMFDQMKQTFDDGRIVFGIYAASSEFFVAVLTDDTAMNSACPDTCDAAKTLDVNVLHKLILEKTLNIGDKQLASQSNIEYIKDIGDAIDRSIAKVDLQKSQAVFFMNPTKIEQVRAIADAGEKMPQKSTFFYPKVFTGLVVNKL